VFLQRVGDKELSRANGELPGKVRSVTQTVTASL